MEHFYASNRFNICIILFVYFICSKQLYEAEDNSFYSEAIFNAGFLFQMLQVCSKLNFIVIINLTCPAIKLILFETIYIFFSI